MQAQQLSNLMKEAEDLVQKATRLSTGEQRILSNFLTQRLKLQEAQAELNSMKEREAQKGRPWSGKSLLQLIDELNANIPAEVLSQVPSDGAEEHDHYIYGTPKKSSKT